MRVIALLFIIMYSSIAFGITGAPICDGTIQAWSSDTGMREYMSTHRCDCRNGNRSSPVCEPISSGQSSQNNTSYKSKRSKKFSSKQYTQQVMLQKMTQYYQNMVQAHQAQISKSMDAAIMGSQQVNRAQQEAIAAEEERRLMLAAQEQIKRNISHIELSSALEGLPQSGKLQIDLSATAETESSFNSDDFHAALADKLNDHGDECKKNKELIERYKKGIERIDDNIEKNDRMMKQAQDGEQSALKEAKGAATDFVADKVAGGLQDKMFAFAKAQKNLQKLKNGLNQIEKLKGVKGGASELTPAQLKQARAWIDAGEKYGDKVSDLLDMTVKAVKSPSGAKTDKKLGKKIEQALLEFNNRFMNDAGGWEFVGKHLAEYGGGPAGKLAFETAVASIKVGVSSADYLMRKAEVGEFQYYHGKFMQERFKLQQKIKELEKKCP